MNVPPTHIIYANDEHKRFADFCNALRCPLCNSQLDGNVHRTMARLYCCQNNEEYKVVWKPGIDEPIEESVSYWYTQYQYVIYWSYVPGYSKSTVTRYNMDAHPIHRMKTAKVLFTCGSRLTYFNKRMEEELFLKKLKTYQVFS